MTRPLTTDPPQRTFDKRNALVKAVYSSLALGAAIYFERQAIWEVVE